MLGSPASRSESPGSGSAWEWWWLRLCPCEWLWELALDLLDDAPPPLDSAGPPDIGICTSPVPDASEPPEAIVLVGGSG